MHPWGQVELRGHQQVAFRELEELLATQAVARPICLVGDFGVGKTTVARYWLAQHFEDPTDCYCALGRPLLDGLKREGDLDRLANSLDEARTILHLELADLIERRLEGKEALVLDAIEILMPYRVPLLSIVQARTRATKIVVICVPDSPERDFHFRLPPAECHCVFVGLGQTQGT